MQNIAINWQMTVMPYNQIRVTGVVKKPIPEELKDTDVAFTILFKDTINILINATYYRGKLLPLKRFPRNEGNFIHFKIIFKNERDLNAFINSYKRCY